MPVINRIAAFHDDMKAWRRDIHSRPELAYEENRTADLVAAKLAEFGIAVHRGLAKTGVVGTLRAGTSSRAIGLRAVMAACMPTAMPQRGVDPVVCAAQIVTALQTISSRETSPLDAAMTRIAGGIATMGSEDFAFMLEAKPGAYVFLGNGTGPSLHNPRYDFNDEILPVGASYWATLIEQNLARSTA